MKQDEKDQLKAILSEVDEAFLVALANKGLVRRAQKDLDELGTDKFQIEETDQYIIVRGPDWVVSMPPKGPAHAKDDTKASGITRQILTATLFLARHWAASATTLAPVQPTATPTVSETTSASTDSATAHGADLEAALLKVTVADLTKWAGKKLFTDVSCNMTSPPHLETEHGVGLTLRLSEHDVELRLFPTKASGARLLDEILSTAPKALHKNYVVLALLALRHKSGEPDKLTTALPTTITLSNQHVLHETQRLLEDMLRIGVAHPSSRMSERLLTLSMSLSAVHLPRLSYLLRALADEVENLLDRDASADSQRCFSAMSQAYALSTSMISSGAQIPRHLAGAAKTQYDSAGDLRLSGVGCYSWRTQSGFEGLTMLLWDETNNRFLTWSDSRPLASRGEFDVKSIYQNGSTWTAGFPPTRLCRSSFLLKNARTNQSGRLSSGQQTTVSETVALQPGGNINFGTDLLKSWNELRERMSAQYPCGLKTLNPADKFVVLQPSNWGTRFFDELQQAFCWQLADATGQLITLTTPWNEVTSQAIDFMEGLNPVRDKLMAVVAQLVFTGSGFIIEPLSFISTGTESGDVVLNPMFDRLPFAKKPDSLIEKLKQKIGFKSSSVNVRPRTSSTTMTSDSDWDELVGISFDTSRVPLPLRNLLLETESLLLQLAEIGAQRNAHQTAQKLSDLANRLQNCGLSELGEQLVAVSSNNSTGAMLRAEYMRRLHWQVLAQKL